MTVGITYRFPRKFFDTNRPFGVLGRGNPIILLDALTYDGVMSLACAERCKDDQCKTGGGGGGQ